MRSTGNVMTLVTEKWNHCLHSPGEGKAVALDISKAFDRAGNTALLTKLGVFDLDDKLFKWIESFFNGHSSLLDGVESECHTQNDSVLHSTAL